MDQPTRIQLAADMGDVGSAGHLEVPIQGPGRANLLVCINGITLRGWDTENAEPERLEFFIETDYKLLDNDVLINSSAYACLASIGADDNKPMEVALDEATVIRRTSNAIMLKLSGEILGDTTLFRIGYQINLVVVRVL